MIDIELNTIILSDNFDIRMLVDNVPFDDEQIKLFQKTCNKSIFYNYFVNISRFCSFSNTTLI